MGNNKLLVGCSGWNYPDLSDKGGWVGSFYPDARTRFLHFYSNYFLNAEMDSTFYDKFYSKMTKGTFIGIGKATPDGFTFSLKFPETITHTKQMRLDAPPNFEGFLDKISPLKNMNKLGLYFSSCLLVLVSLISEKLKDSLKGCPETTNMQ